MKTNAKHNSRPGRILHVGIDVGSTTTKIAVIDSETKEVLYSDYQRHHAEQLRSVRKALLKFNEEFPDEKIRVVLTGSGAKPIADAGFDGVWITISNPCDVVATEIWKLSGMDPNRIIGTGTALDSSRLKYALSRATGYDQHSICAYMLGEHGSSMFAAWSAVNFGGKPLAQLREEQPERFGFDEAQVEQEARHGGYVTYAGKQCTEFAVADAAVRLVRAVVSNEHYITPCSTLMTGDYGESGFFTSLPCVIGANGVEEVLHFDLSDAELREFQSSCAHVKENLRRIRLL